jgi:hypothetical protein
MRLWRMAGMARRAVRGGAGFGKIMAGNIIKTSHDSARYDFAESTTLLCHAEGERSQEIAPY